jgi:ribosomal protein S18 acetylase RimI-like enzyme
MKPDLNEITIRTFFRPGDMGYITYMHGQFYEFGTLFEVYVSETLSTFYKELNPKKERMWIAEHQGKIIGTIALKNTDDEAQLRYFLLDPAYRGIGLGKKMMDLYMEFTRKCGYKSSFLLTEKNLEAASNIYQRYGYKHVSTQETEMGVTTQRYELKL